VDTLPQSFGRNNSSFLKCRMPIMTFFQTRTLEKGMGENNSAAQKPVKHKFGQVIKINNNSYKS
jgi:hypothetical protein